MNKFNVGDRVRYIKWGYPGEVIEVKNSTVRIKWDSVGEGFYFYPSDKFELVKSSNTSPVRIKTVKEIVPGVYGRVAVNEPTQVDKVKEIPVNLVYKNGNNTQHWRYLTATELRETAKLFQQLAEALDDN